MQGLPLARCGLHDVCGESISCNVLCSLTFPWRRAWQDGARPDGDRQFDELARFWRHRPRVITCAEELTHHISLPRGCAFEARKLLEEHGVALAVDDKRHDGAPLELKFNGELTVVQKEMAQALLEHDTGVLVAPPGIGKTVLGTYLVALRARSALILAHRKPLLEQWIAQLAIFLDVNEK